jgi:integrase
MSKNARAGMKAGYLYRPKHPPKGWKYKDAASAGMLRESPTFWVKYYVNGKPVRESTGTEKESEAKRFLKLRLGAAAAGTPIAPKADRIRYEEAAADLLRHYEVTRSRNLAEYRSRVKPVDKFFAGRLLTAIDQPQIDAYVLQRRADGLADGTIRRELRTLTRMLRLAFRNRKLRRLPLLDLPKEGAPRSGFFEREQYEAVRRYLRPDLQVAIDIAHTLGWRMQSEILTLERRQLDLDAGTLRLDPGTTKNGEGRLVYLSADLKASLAAQVERVKALERQTDSIIPYLFPHGACRRAVPRMRGQRIRDFRMTWATACKKAGCPGMLRHDFRRTAVRNLVKDTVSEKVAMTITGHKSRTVFDRYHIVSEGDLREAARKMGINSGIASGKIPAAVCQLADSKEAAD